MRRRTSNRDSAAQSLGRPAPDGASQNHPSTEAPVEPEGLGLHMPLPPSHRRGLPGGHGVCSCRPSAATELCTAGRSPHEGPSASPRRDTSELPAAGALWAGHLRRDLRIPLSCSGSHAPLAGRRIPGRCHAGSAPVHGESQAVSAGDTLQEGRKKPEAT